MVDFCAVYNIELKNLLRDNVHAELGQHCSVIYNYLAMLYMQDLFVTLVSGSTLHNEGVNKMK